VGSSSAPHTRPDGAWLSEVTGSCLSGCAFAVAAACRERCGGQGYLSVNRFGELIGFAHAGMTAEGDNRCASKITSWCMHIVNAQYECTGRQQVRLPVATLMHEFVTIPDMLVPTSQAICM
jgi:hypothetical protein